MNLKIGIILIVERGILEKYTLLAVKSIRVFGGQLSKVPIICYSPRKDYYPSAKSQRALKNHDVEVITHNLNREFRYYSLANKPKVIHEINNNHDFDYLVFLDSDTILLQEPKKLFNYHHPVAASPSWLNLVGAKNMQDPNYTYWEELSRLLGFDLESSPYVKLQLENSSYLGNWNTGVLSFNRQAKSDLIERWGWCLEKILRNKLFPPKHNIYLSEETAFASAVMLGNEKVENLSIHYNFPVEKSFDNKMKRIEANLSEAKVIHHLKHHNHLLSYAEWHESSVMEEKRKWLVESIKEVELNKTDKYGLKDRLFFFRKALKERGTYLLQKHFHWE